MYYNTGFIIAGKALWLLAGIRQELQSLVTLRVTGAKLLSLSSLADSSVVFVIRAVYSPYYAYIRGKTIGFA